MSFKICSIGCGGMATAVHGPSFKKYAGLHSDTVLAACCDVNEERAELFKQDFGFLKHYTDIDLMLDTEKPDAVCMIVPVHMTAALTVKILEKGYPLILEKPPGLNRKETMEMIESAKRLGTPNQVAFNRRYIPLVGSLMELIDKQHGTDKILNIHYQMLRVGRMDQDFSTTAVHGIDLVKHIAGSDFESIRFDYHELGHIGKNVVNIRMDCKFKSGIHAQLNFFPVGGIEAERLEINAYNNAYYLNLPCGPQDSFGKLLHFEKKELMLELTGNELSKSEDTVDLSGFYRENEMFFEDIRNGRKPKGDIQSGLQSVEIMESIRNRAKEYNF